MMNKLPELTNLWNTPDFDKTVLQALSKLEIELLPLKELASSSGLFVQDSLQFSILNKQATGNHLVLKLGVFYQEISSMCPCSGEDPETIDGHCEIKMTINKPDGLTHFSLL